MHDTSTRSPTAQPVAGPASTTVPTASWPRILPGVTSGTSPLRMCRSVPQIVVASTRTIASRSSIGTGNGTSRHSACPGPSKTSPFIVIVKPPVVPSPLTVVTPVHCATPLPRQGRRPHGGQRRTRPGRANDRLASGGAAVERLLGEHRQPELWAVAVDLL